MALIILLVAQTLCSAPTNQELFLQGNAAYREKNYEQALALYTQLSNKGSVVWYNMGNCAYKLNRYPDAYVYWKKSEHGASWSLLNDSAHNIERIVHGSDDEYFNTVYQRIKQMVHTYSVWSSWLWLQCLLLFFWSIFWVLYVRRFARVAQGLVLLLMCCCGIALKGKYMHTTTTAGLVILAQAPVYAGPDTTFARIAQLDEMAEVMVVQEKNKTWYKISYKDQEGWMAAETITLV